MSGIHTTIVTPAHGYTREKTPWILGEHRSVYGKLIHYLSGGGMSTFGRTIQQELARAKHIRFGIVSAAVGAVWLLFFFI